MFASACNLDNPGIKPPQGQISYPWAVGLTTDETGRATHLIVVNSNFDLRYNAGSVQAYDLDVLDQLIVGAGGDENCLFLSSKTAGAAFEGGTFTDNTIYPDASPLDEAGAQGDAGDAGFIEGGAPDAGDGAVSADGGVADAAVADAGMDLDASTLDGGADTDGSVAERGPIVFPTQQVYGSQRGILCDGRDGFYQPPDGAMEISLEQRCCYTREDVLKVPEQLGRDLLTSELRIDSYATGLSISPGNRLYIPIRSKNRLVYIDAVNGQLDCGGQWAYESENNCIRGVSERTAGALPDIRFPSTPNSLTSGKLSDLGLTEEQLGLLEPKLTPEATFITTVHEEGEASLFVDDGSGPVLYDVLTGGVRLQNSITSARARNLTSDDPASQLLYVTSSSTMAPGIARLGVRVRDYVDTDEQRMPSLQFYNSSPIVLNGISSPLDQRGVQVDPDDPKRLSVLIRGNQQHSVAFIRLDSTATSGTVHLESRTGDLIVVGQGPSKLISATLRPPGQPESEGRKFVFASCYNEGSIYIFDLENEAQVVQLSAEVLGLNGPYAMTVDETRARMYVADNASSVVRVVDLRGLVESDQPPPRIVATLGGLRFAERIK
jgi:hypothetical protein